MKNEAKPSKEDLLELIKNVTEWNKWRERNPQTLVDLMGANLEQADLREVNLSGADLRGVEFKAAQLMDANLRRANLFRARLWSANLARTNLYHADLGQADLAEAQLTGATLTGATLVDANLNGANLQVAELESANLMGAKFMGANLAEANLFFADLREADLREAQIDLASLSGTAFGKTNLRGTKGLENCEHLGPSIIDFQTLLISNPLPLAFLRGCGLPDIFIEYLPALLGQGIEFYSCFISYSTKDQEFADRLYADLQNKGIRCWFAPHELRGGRKVHEQIDEAIRIYDRFLIVLSEHSMESEWVKTEIAKARARETKNKRRVLFPISLVAFDPYIKSWECFDADTGKDSAREIREYYIPNFATWKDPDAYQQELDALIKSLKKDCTLQ